MGVSGLGVWGFGVLFCLALVVLSRRVIMSAPTVPCPKRTWNLKRGPLWSTVLLQGGIEVLKSGLGGHAAGGQR